MITIPIGSSSQNIIFIDGVLSHFEKHRQILPNQKEAGGQLFASFHNGEILVEKATGPRSSDKRGRTYYYPDRKAEQKEIIRLHKKGLHYIGDWHTHPELAPSPSELDLRNINDCVLKSKHNLHGFVLVVVGQSPMPQGLHISVHDGAYSLVLKHSPV